MHIRVRLIGGLAAVLAGCVTGPHGWDVIVPAPAEAAVAAARAGMAATDITRAANLYVLKCARCHKFYDPADYNDQAWSTWLRKMSKKSRLEPDEENLLTRYLEAARKPVRAEPQ